MSQPRFPSKPKKKIESDETEQIKRPRGIVPQGFGLKILKA